MLNAIVLKDNFFRLIYFVISSLLFYPLVGQSAVFNVTNEDELRDALSMAESNGEEDVINLADGLYRTFGEPFTFETDEDFSLTIEGKGASLTMLDGDGLSRVLTIQSIPGNPTLPQFPVTLENLTIQKGNNQSSGNFFDEQGGGLFIYNASSVTIDKCMFIDNSTLGAGGAGYISAVNLYLYDNEFYGNVSGSSAGGFYGNFYSQEISNVNIINNIFAQNVSLSGYLESGAASILGAEKVNIINNTITMNYSGEGSGALVLEIPYQQDNVINIYNNIVIANDIIEGSDILVITEPYPVPTTPPTGFPGPVTVDYGTVNLFNNDYSVFEAEKTFGCDVSQVTCVLEINEGNNILDLPLFVNPEAADFSLLPDSPCIDAGDPDAPDVPDTDIYGNPRVPPPDMGAVEFIQMVVDGEGGGGCSIASTSVTSTLAVFLVVPVLILMRRIIKRNRG